MNAVRDPIGAPGGGTAREFVFTPDDFAQIARTLHAHSGIALAESKSALVYSRLARRLRALGLRSFREYCRLVAGSEGAEELQQMVAALTTNVTSFFREAHHFEHLRRSVLPKLAAKARQGGRVRLWSAACSTGPEPWSMAMCLLAEMPDALDYDVKILATDIDPYVLDEARAGVYRADLVGPVPADLRERFMVRDGADWSMGEDARELVSFRSLNLMVPWPMRGKFDVVFCRNVVIYFDDAGQETVWSKFAQVMAPGGRLYIGHSERVSGPAAGRFRSDGLTTYAFEGGPHA